MLGHKTSLNKLKIEIFSSLSGIKLEINYKEKTEKHTDMWQLSKHAAGQRMELTTRSKNKSKDTLRSMKREAQ